MSNALRLIGGEFKRLVSYKLLARSLATGVIWILVFLFISTTEATKVAPMLMFVDVSIVLMMLLGASFYLERQENTIKSIMVMPVSLWQILSSKIVSSLMLTMITIAITCAAVYFIHDISFNYALLLIFVIFAAVAHAAIGFLLALLGKNLGSMLILAIAYALVFVIPSILLAVNIIDAKHGLAMMISPSHTARMLFSSVVSGEYKLGETLFGCIYLPVSAMALMRLVVYPMFKSRAVTG
jgi:ABC-type transport system involved in multi-copper enzyme maturation permease subunit